MRWTVSNAGRSVIDLPPLYCNECENALEAERLRQNRLKPSAKKIREEGIANLDRLLGKER